MRIHGLPGYLGQFFGGVIETTALAIEDQRITGIFITRNPDKLGYVAEDSATKPLSGRAV